MKKGKPVYLYQDETWSGRATIINDSLLCISDMLIVLKDELLQRESLNLNLEESLMVLQAFHLFLTRAVFSLNIRKDKFMEAWRRNEEGEQFKNFLTLETKTIEGDFCTRLLGNISSSLNAPHPDNVIPFPGKF